MGDTVNTLEKVGIFQIYPGDQFERKSLDIYGGSGLQLAGLIIYDDHEGDNQKFILRYVKGVFYVLQAKHSGMVLNIAGNGGAGSGIYQYPYNGGDNQLWTF